MTQNFHCGRYVLNADRPLILGIVNLTDDSFSGDGLHGNVGLAVAQGLRQIEEGAHILGAESSRPGAQPIPAQQVIDRLLPVIKALRAPGAVELVVASHAGICVIYMQSDPGTMQDDPHSDDIVAEVATFLGERVAAAEAAGIAVNRSAVDPGFGFSKSLEHNLELLRRLDEIVVPDLPLLVGLSRKSMLACSPDARRRSGSMPASRRTCWRSNWARMDDVAATRDAMAVLQALEDY